MLKRTVVFVLGLILFWIFDQIILSWLTNVWKGGPGVGKGTQCDLISKAFFPDIQHFSAGDLLRKAAEGQSQQSLMIRHILSEGGITPGHITVGLLKDAILQSPAKIILIDGFPRRIDQGTMFENQITPCKCALFLDSPNDILLERLINREKMQQKGGNLRSDDNEICREKVW